MISNRRSSVRGFVRSNTFLNWLTPLYSKDSP
jgi:hypothetical protein